MNVIASIFFSVLMVVASLSAYAQDDTIIYKEKSSNGAPVFTDQPAPDATPEQLSAPNIIDAPPNIPAPANKDTAVNNYSVQISVPEDSQPEIGLSVSVNVTPAWQSGMSVEIIVDGASYTSGAQTRFTLIGLNSGIRNLQAILKRGDTILARSATTPVEVLRLGGARNRR